MLLSVPPFPVAKQQVLPHPSLTSPSTPLLHLPPTSSSDYPHPSCPITSPPLQSPPIRYQSWHCPLYIPTSHMHTAAYYTAPQHTHTPSLVMEREGERVGIARVVCRSLFPRYLMGKGVGLTGRLYKGPWDNSTIYYMSAGRSASHLALLIEQLV